MTYTHVAVLIHWLTAITIIALLGIGKFMVSLDEADTLRFTLTQSHKTFGILVLALSVLRVAWRLSHKAPPHPAGAPTWEKLAASLSHLAFYGLIFVLPLSGWAMVSVSSLNIDTLLFNRIELPHLPLMEWLSIADRTLQDEWEHRFHQAHTVSGGVLIALIVLHISAALKHHFVDKDDVLRRMKPRYKEPAFIGLVIGSLVVIAGSAFALNQYSQSQQPVLVAGNSSVSLLAVVSSEDTEIRLPESQIDANIQLEDPAASALSASVTTGSATSDNFQVAGSLPDAEWFDSSNFPTATFEASAFTEGPEPNSLSVQGVLTIKGKPHDVSFVLAVTEATADSPARARTTFPVDRFALGLGEQSQPNTDYVDSTVLIRVEFELSADG